MSDGNGTATIKEEEVDLKATLELREQRIEELEAAVQELVSRLERAEYYERLISREFVDFKQTIMQRFQQAGASAGGEDNG